MRRGARIATPVLLVASLAACASRGDVARLEARISDLEQRSLALEGRVEAAEERASAAEGEAAHAAASAERAASEAAKAAAHADRAARTSQAIFEKTVRK